MSAASRPAADGQAIVDAARRFFDDFVRGNEARAFPWMPSDLLTALVEDYDRRNSEPYRCRCGDQACPLWNEDIVCPYCSAKLAAISADPEFEGRGGDMGEGHYGDCPHGAA